MSVYYLWYDKANRKWKQHFWVLWGLKGLCLCVEHMACCLLLMLCALLSIICPLPSCYLIIVLVAPPVSPSLPSFVSLYSSPCVCSPVLIRCLSCVVCYMWVLCLTVLQSSACLLVFPLRGGFCSSLFYIIIIKITISSAFESSTSSLVTIIRYKRFISNQLY